jgi:hypothetical protein
MTEHPLSSGADVGDHQVITRAGQVEALLCWAVHEARYPSRPGDDVPEGKAYDLMDALLADLDLPE